MHRYSKEYRRFYIGLAFAAAGPILSLTAAHATAAPARAEYAAPAIAPVSRLAVTDLGRAPRNTRINIVVSLKYRNADQLESFITATSNPSSPEFGHFLTPAQFTSAFAPTAAEYGRVAVALQQGGFTITRTSSTRTTINASAPVAVAEAFFSTTIHAVKQPNEVAVHYANATAATVPAALRDVVFGVAGLNDLIVAKAHNVRGMRHVDTALGFPLQGPDTGLSPFALATAYDFPVQHQRPGAKPGITFDGTGHAAGIVIDSDLLDSDLEAFLAYFKIKRTGPGLIRVPVDGGSTINFDGVETNLDVETIAGLAPGAAVYVYLIPNLSTPSIVDGYTKIVEDDKLDAVDSSFGGCELADNLATLSDHIAIQGAAEGITFNASTGDSGAQTCLFFTPSGLGVSAPAVAPHFTGVGGTSLLINNAGSYVRELSWTGSGGGISTIFPEPAYQRGVRNVVGTTRNLPDISFDANPGTGSSLYYQGAFVGPIGGTSLSSPVFTALVTEYNETIGKRSGLINTAIYGAFKSSGYGARFRDITLGNNSYFGPGYNALPGYDDVTGIGSIIGTANAK